MVKKTPERRKFVNKSGVCRRRRKGKEVVWRESLGCGEGIEEGSMEQEGAGGRRGRET